MRIDIISAFPGMFSGPLSESMIKKAQERNTVEIVVHNLRDYAHDRHHTLDDSPYGGGAGMVLKPEPLFECVDSLQAQRQYDEIVLLAAEGEVFRQPIANEFSLYQSIILICGHYKGVDERVRERLVTREISIGDYVLTGGEIPALVIVDAVVRLLPGALGDSESVLNDSFQDGFLDSPQYTRPPEFRGMKVPDVLLSGDHEEVRKWREQMSAVRTAHRRPDLLDREADLSDCKRRKV